MILVGLGNPGSKYDGTRHNIGFEVVEKIISDYSFSTPLKKFSALYSEGEIAGKKVRVLMPQTFMNLSGEAVIQAVNFYKETLKNILVIHDELDLPLGKIRMKTGGGNGGHNGLKSIDEKMSAEYRRMRVGIGHPGDKDMVSSYVLSKFANPERPVVDDIVSIIAKNISLAVEGRDNDFSTKFALEADKIIPKIEDEK